MANDAAEKGKIFACRYFNFEFEGPKKTLRSSGSSPFQVWQNVPPVESVGVAKGRSKEKLDAVSVNSYISAPQAEDNNNSKISENLINGLGIATYGGKGIETGFNLNESLESIAKNESRIKRMKANRRYAAKYRSKQNQYLTNLECQKSVLKETISGIYTKIEENVQFQESILTERRQIQQQMVARQEERLIQEVKMAHYKEEINRLTNMLKLKHSLMTEYNAMDQNHDT